MQPPDPIEADLPEAPQRAAPSADRAVFRCLLIAGATDLTAIFLGCLDSKEVLNLALIEMGMDVGVFLFLFVAVGVVARWHKDRDLCVIGVIEFVLFIAVLKFAPIYPHFR